MFPPDTKRLETVFFCFSSPRATSRLKSLRSLRFFPRLNGMWMGPSDEPDGAFSFDPPPFPDFRSPPYDLIAELLFGEMCRLNTVSPSKLFLPPFTPAKGRYSRFSVHVFPFPFQEKGSSQLMIGMPFLRGLHKLF